LIAWAIAALIADYDSPSLRILAGLTPLNDDHEVREFFAKALHELGIPQRSPEDCIRVYAYEVCRLIVADAIAPQVGHQILYGIWLQTSHSDAFSTHDYDIWLYLDDSYDLVRCGYSSLLPEFEGLNPETYPDIVKRTAISFIHQSLLGDQ
jgi:hypothetical protein